MKVLITGATGNVGKEVISALSQLHHELDIYAGVRDLNEIEKLKGVTAIQFDFTDRAICAASLRRCDILFLLRPPQISDVKKYFKPLIDTCKDVDVKHIVFLSVQGVEKSTVIPHHKIEKLIVESEIPYTFLRPAYFMQNFTTTLRKDIVENDLIYLPAGLAKFTIIDVRDVGSVAASVLTNTPLHINRSYDLTNREKYTFYKMAELLSINLGRDIQFKSPNLVSFFMKKKKEGTSVMLILVMIMLHYLPRFQKEPEVTMWAEKIADRQPKTFEEFIGEHKKELSK